MSAARARSTTVWVVLVGVLAVVCVVGGVLALQARGARAQADTRQVRYAAVLAAAEDESTAFVNVRHDTVAADLEKIAAGATGALRQRYTSSAPVFARALRRDRTVTVGSVVWSGVVALDATHATVIAATTGTRADRRTHGEPVARDLRLRLDLVLVGSRWLTSDIRTVD